MVHARVVGDVNTTAEGNGPALPTVVVEDGEHNHNTAEAEQMQPAEEPQDSKSQSKPLDVTTIKQADEFIKVLCIESIAILELFVPHEEMALAEGDMHEVVGHFWGALDIIFRVSTSTYSYWLAS